MENKIYKHTWTGNTLVHIDDFVLCASDAKTCDEMEKCFDTLMETLGVIISKKLHSYVHTCTTATIYGIEWNLTTKKCKIPLKKLIKFRKYLQIAIKYRACTARFIDYIAGNILYFAQLNPLAKCSVWRLMKYLTYNIRTDLYKASDVILLPLDIINDFKFWFKYTTLVCDIPIADIIYKPSITIYGSSDASDAYGGWIVGKKWSFYKFNDTDKNLHINQKEFHTVLCLLNTLKHELTGKKLHIYIDNTTTVNGIINKWSKKYNIMTFIYELCLLMIEYKLYVYVDWISSATTVIADSLSRKKFKLFWKTIKIHNMIVEPTPTKTKYYDNYSFKNPKLNNSMTIKQEYYNFIYFMNLPLSIRNQYHYKNGLIHKKTQQ